MLKTQDWGESTAPNDFREVAEVRPEEGLGGLEMEK